MAIFSTGVVVLANISTVTREVTYGISVMLNGETVGFDYDTRLFVMNNRTFLPVRTLAELLGLPVDFDPVTNTAILGVATIPTDGSTPLNIAAPFFDVGGVRQFFGGWWTDVTELASVEMGGVPYNNVVSYQSHVSPTLSCFLVA